MHRTGGRAQGAGRPRHAQPLAGGIIRFGDLDVLGHVNNVAYMVYFETDRVTFLEQLGRPPRYREHGPVFVLAHIAADYLEELYYPGKVDIGTALRHVGNSSFHLDHGIFVGVIARRLPPPSSSRCRGVH